MIKHRILPVHTTEARPGISAGALLVPVLIVLDSLHFVFARLLLPHIAPEVSVMFVLAVSTLEVGLFGLVTRQISLSTLRRRLWFFLAIGTLIAVSTAINYHAVAFIDPGTASLLSQTSVLFGLAFGLLWLHDRFTRRQLAGAAVAVVGVFVISFQQADYLRLGSLLVIASAAMYALHAAITKQYGSDIRFIDFFFFRLLLTTAILLAFSTVRGSLTWPSPTAWTLIVLVGTVDVVLSRALYYVALRRLTLSMHTLILLLSPAAAVLWSWLLFNVLPTLRQIAGGLAVILGIFIVMLNHKKG